MAKRKTKAEKEAEAIEKAEKEQEKKVAESRAAANAMIAREAKAEKEAKPKKQQTPVEARKSLLIARLKEQTVNPKYPQAQIEVWYQELQDINNGLWTPDRKKRQRKRLSAQEMLDRVTAND